MKSSNDAPKTNNITGAKGKIAIVTGSSKGIGKAIALAFAKSKEYYGIAVNGIKMQKAQEVADQIKSVGCDSIAIEADISKESDCIKLIEGTKKYFGRIDILVNNAGIQHLLKILPRKNGTRS